MELNGRKCFKKGWSTSGEKSPADVSKRNSPVTLTVAVLVGRSLACSGIPGNGDQNSEFFPSESEIELMSHASEECSLNHQTTRKVPKINNFYKMLHRRDASLNRRVARRECAVRSYLFIYLFFTCQLGDVQTCFLLTQDVHQKVSS